MKAAASKAVQAGSTALPQALSIPADPLEPQLLHYYTNDATERVNDFDTPRFGI
jgi:hypothetical protein